MKTNPNFHPDALQYLEAWFARHEAAWLTQGAEPQEVRADIRSAIAERFEGATDIGVPALREILETMEPPAAVESPPSDEPKATSLPVCRSEKSTWYARNNASCAASPGLLGRFFGLFHPGKGFWLLVWPALVVGAELVWHICGGLFFDPMPTHWHLAAILLAILTGGLVWRRNRKDKATDAVESPHPLWLHMLRGFSMVTTGYLAILQLPLLLMGTFYYFMIVIMSFGLGIFAIPLYLLCAMAAASPLLLFFGLLRVRATGRNGIAEACGLLLGFAGLLALEGRAVVTRFAGENTSPSFLRTVGSEDTLLKLCYEGQGGRRTMTDTSGYLVGLLRGTVFGGMAQPGDVEKWRLLHYRVTGRPFNAKPPPAEMTLSRNAGLFDDLEWDPDLGGDGVYARLRGLDLCSSRLDGHVDAASGLGYWEWTMEFNNRTSESKEARMQVLLPPGAVLSKLTLWVNDQPQEAAFAGGDVVAKAYKQVAVVQRKDPVLARWVGPDRIFVQCFPVPAGRRMKIRLGTTAPLDPGGRLFFPRFLEQNFGYTKGLATDLWVQGDTRLQVDGITNGSTSHNWREVHGSLPISRQAEASGCVLCPEAVGAPVVWTKDPFAEAGREILVRTTVAKKPVDSASREKVIIVIDTSKPLEAWKMPILDALKMGGGHGIEIHQVVAATDEGASLVEFTDLPSLTFEGGKDNRAALMMGIETGINTGAATILWLHGPQPVEFGSTDGIEQLLERAFRKPRIVSIELAAGPNRLLEKIGARRWLAPSSSRVADTDDLLPVLRQEARPSSTRYEYTRIPLGQQPEGAREVWDQLARFHSWQSVIEATDLPGMGTLAARYQLVTPVSGAVVLETKEQFQQHGLNQVDASSTPSIPSIPEPGTSALLLTTVLIALRRRR